METKPEVVPTEAPEVNSQTSQPEKQLDSVKQYYYPEQFFAKPVVEAEEIEAMTREEFKEADASEYEARVCDF